MLFVKATEGASEEATDLGATEQVTDEAGWKLNNV